MTTCYKHHFLYFLLVYLYVPLVYIHLLYTPPPPSTSPWTHRDSVYIDSPMKASRVVGTGNAIHRYVSDWKKKEDC